MRSFCCLSLLLSFSDVLSRSLSSSSWNVRRSMRSPLQTTSTQNGLSKKSKTGGQDLLTEKSIKAPPAPAASGRVVQWSSGPTSVVCFLVLHFCFCYSFWRGREEGGGAVCSCLVLFLPSVFVFAILFFVFASSLLILRFSSDSFALLLVFILLLVCFSIASLSLHLRKLLHLFS